jgi:hypothetical protein
MPVGTHFIRLAGLVSCDDALSRERTDRVGLRELIRKASTLSIGESAGQISKLSFGIAVVERLPLALMRSDNSHRKS